MIRIRTCILYLNILTRYSCHRLFQILPDDETLNTDETDDITDPVILRCVFCIFQRSSAAAYIIMSQVQGCCEKDCNYRCRKKK